MFYYSCTYANALRPGKEFNEINVVLHTLQQM